MAGHLESRRQRASLALPESNGRPPNPSSRVDRRGDVRGVCRHTIFDEPARLWLAAWQRLAEAKPDPYAQAAEAALRGARAAVLGICASVVLATIKILAGVIGNAYVLIADGVESILDVFSSLVVWGSLRIAAAPPNERYPYGYGRVEPLAALVASLTLLAAAVGIAIESVREIVTPHHAPAAFTLRDADRRGDRQGTHVSRLG